MARLTARYRDPHMAKEVAEAFPRADWNDVLDTLLAHRSVRHYSDRALPPDALEMIIAAAQSAPTTSNLQAWSVIAVRDPGRKARLAKLAGNQQHVAKAPLLLVFVADLSRLRMIAAGCGQTSEGLDYLESFIVAIADAAFAAQNTLVAAESIGLGGCYIGAMRNHPREVAAELGLPDEVFGVFGMTLGYPDATVETDVKPRLPQTMVLHHEQYEQASPEALAIYDQRLRGFRSEQQMTDIDWTEQAARRISDKRALMGRHVLREILQSRGFGLR
ncbi:MAG: NADPH-dependent oxidoreductase [Ancalomicrobiaceae bacterium]|nr:NADPH-dependent oxidoreductase [Ancalomicrobiaceae bacterium]